MFLFVSAASRGTASDVVAVLSAGLMLALTAAAVAVMVMVAAGQTSFANLCGTVVLALVSVWIDPRG